MAETALTLLLEQVKEVMIGYKDLISGTENEINLLNNELGLVKAFLMDGAKAKKQEHMFRELESQIRDVIYEVEDAVDTCLTKAMHIQARSMRYGLLRVYNRINLAKEIKFIREEKVVPMFNDIKARFSEMLIADGSESMEYSRSKFKRLVKQIVQNRQISYIDEERIITSCLMEQKEELDVIPIIGIPGQGKTTLAWNIYESKSIDNHFPIRIWVSISQKFNSRNVLLQILRKFIPTQDTSSLTYDDLIQIVRGCLEKEKFLLVLDDVRSVDTWMEIRQALPFSNEEAKVLITSRDHKVGVQSSNTGKPHVLRFLTDDESWKLLQNVVFGNETDCPQELEEVGKRVAFKCEGLPLTIVVAGGILTISSSKAVSIQEWKSLGYSIENSLLAFNQVQRITDVVALSYERLSHELRQCFVFSGVFPGGYEIPAKMLCMLWIAEGFILPKTGKSLEESAEENLDDLICRNLLKVEKLNHMGRVKTCRVHDMIRTFCVRISKDENLFQEIRKPNKGIPDPLVTDVQKSRRLCFHSDLSRFLSETPRGPHVRSFLCFFTEPIELEPQFISVIPDGFPKLRILESKCIIFDQFPHKVTKLIHLRYLTLYIYHLTTLPESISQLWNLQTLAVETKSRSIKMKANIWKMIRLRHLKSKAAIDIDSKWQGDAGQNLQTLHRLAPESCTEVVFKKAKNLRTLGIYGKLDSTDFDMKVLAKLLCLEKLKLVSSLSYESSEDMLSSVPQPNCFPPNLKRLTLTNTFLGWKHMSTLAMVKSLEALKLKDNAFVGVSWNASRDSFPNLQLLLIVNADLVLWNASAHTFPSLRCLVVKNCENLREIPECLGTTHLEKLEIERVRYSVVESAQKIAEKNKENKKGNVGDQSTTLIIGRAYVTK